MNQNPSEARIFYSGLLHIPRALCNEKALFVLLATGLLALALVFLGYTLSSSAPFVATMLGFVILLVVLPAGASIAGLLLMDQAHGQTPRPLRKAVSDGIPAFLRIFSIKLLCIALVVVFIVFLGVALLVCKLPAVGAALYAVLFPAFLILGGLLHFGLMLGLSMACPAVWNGATVREALETLRRIVTHRSLELLVNLLLLAALIALAKFILVGIVFVGSLPVSMVSATILGAELSTVFSGSAESGHALAVIFGFMLILTLILTALTVMGMMGLNLIYLQITEDLPPVWRKVTAGPFLTYPQITEGLPPPKAMEQAMPPAPRGSTDRKEPSFPPFPQATGIGSTGGNPSGGTQDILASRVAETPPAPGTPENAKTAPICPRCKAAAQPGDCFCGECGGSLQG